MAALSVRSPAAATIARAPTTEPDVIPPRDHGLRVVVGDDGRQVVHDDRPLDDPSEPIFDQGLRFDVETIGRRRALRLLLGGAGGLVLAACSDGGRAGTVGDVSATATAADPTTTATAGDAGRGTGEASVDGAADAACADPIPEETAGPFPGDGTNGPDVLAESGVVRRDLRTSVGAASGTAEGVPMELELVVRDADAGCAPLAGAAVYAWHCTADGRYTMYEAPYVDENFLRGVQAADDDGVVRFTTVFPGCYAGRWPHVHLEVFPTLDAAGAPANRIATSQLAFPRASCEQAYADDRYGDSLANLGRLSLETDGVFRDGFARQLATVTGSNEAGWTARLVMDVGRA